MQHEGLKVADVVVLIDREQGGAARMASNGLRLHSAFTLSFIIGVLRRHDLVSEQVAADVKAFIAGNQTFDASAPKPQQPPQGQRGMPCYRWSTSLYMGTQIFGKSWQHVAHHRALHKFYHRHEGCCLMPSC